MTDWKERFQSLVHWRYMLLTADERDAASWISGPWTAEAALQLGQEMADARAEEIAKRFELGLALSMPDRNYAARTARSFVSHRKTREEVLEEALKEIVARHQNPLFPTPPGIEALARKALLEAESLRGSQKSQEEFHL